VGKSYRRKGEEEEKSGERVEKESKGRKWKGRKEVDRQDRKLRIF
jgi:hypothetical protein